MSPEAEDRMAVVRGLAKEFGGYDAIPNEALANIGYTRIVEEVGLVRVLPVERLAATSLSQDVLGAERERRKPPFEPVTISIEKTTGYGTRLSPYILTRSLRQTCLDLDPDLPARDGRIIKWLPSDHPINLYEGVVGTPRVFKRIGDNAVMAENIDSDHIFEGHISVIVLEIAKQYDLG